MSIFYNLFRYVYNNSGPVHLFSLEKGSIMLSSNEIGQIIKSPGLLTYVAEGPIGNRGYRFIIFFDSRELVKSESIYVSREEATMAALVEKGNLTCRDRRRTGKNKSAVLSRETVFAYAK